MEEGGSVRNSGFPFSKVTFTCSIRDVLRILTIQNISNESLLQNLSLSCTSAAAWSNCLQKRSCKEFPDSHHPEIWQNSSTPRAHFLGLKFVKIISCMLQLLRPSFFSANQLGGDLLRSFTEMRPELVEKLELVRNRHPSLRNMIVN